MPDSYIKQLLGENETILLVTHQHWFLLARNTLPEVLLILLLLAGSIALSVTAALPVPWPALSFLLLLLPIASLLKDVLFWSHHQYIVTNRRVIQIFGVFNKNVIDSSLEKVNDVKLEQSVWGRMFNFGDVEILTASEMGINRFTRIAQPIQFKTAMLNAKARLEQDEDQPRRSTSRGASVPELLADLGRLHQQGVLTDAEFNEKKAQLLARM